MKRGLTVNDVSLVKLSDAEYFGEKYKDYVSNSRLSLLDPANGGSTEAFLKGFDNKEEKPFFNIGSAVHALLLQPDEYFLSKAELPPGKMGLMARMLRNMGISSLDMRTDAIEKLILEIGYYGHGLSDKKTRKVKDTIKPFLEDAEKEHAPKGKLPIYLSAQERKTVLGCIRSLNDNPDVKRLLYCQDDGDACFCEYALLGTMTVCDGKNTMDMKVKCKLDRFVDTGFSYAIQDFKTTCKNLWYFSESIAKFGYDRQAVLYSMMLGKFLEDRDMEFDGFTFMVVSTSDFSSTVLKATGPIMKRGMEKLEDLFIKAMYAMDKKYKKEFQSCYSLKTLPVGFGDKIKLISCFCILLQHFRSKDKDYAFRQLIERIRKDKMPQTSGGMVDKLEMWVEEFYDPKGKYPWFGFKTPKEMSDFINNVLDKELPFSNSLWEEDLPF